MIQTLVFTFKQAKPYDYKRQIHFLMVLLMLNLIAKLINEPTIKLAWITMINYRIKKQPKL